MEYHFPNYEGRIPNHGQVCQAMQGQVRKFLTKVHSSPFWRHPQEQVDRRGVTVALEAAQFNGKQMGFHR